MRHLKRLVLLSGLSISCTVTNEGSGSETSPASESSVSSGASTTGAMSSTGLATEGSTSDTPSSSTPPTTAGSSTEASTSTATTQGETTSTASGGGACGDGILDEGEACDDGNEVDNDGCTLDCTCDGTWVQFGDTIKGEGDDRNFGADIAMSADGATLAIAMQTYNIDTQYTNGKVQVFHREGDAWEKLGGSIPGLPGDSWHRSQVAISGDAGSLIIGNPIDGGNGDDSGVARLYRFEGGEWTKVTDDLHGAIGNWLGHGVALSHDGHTAAIGAPSYDGDLISRVMVYDVEGGMWSQIGETIIDEFHFGLGTSVGISGDGTMLATGAPYVVPISTGQGRSYQLQQGAWLQRGQFLDGDDTNHRFGKTVSISADGGTWVVHAEVYTRVFRLVGDEWAQIGADLDAASSSSINAGGDVIVLGIRDANEEVGVARALHFDGAAWQPRGGDMHGVEAEGFFGDSVTMSADNKVLAVGSMFEMSYEGRVRTYQWCE